MKSIIKTAVILLVLILSPVIFPKQASAQTPFINFQVFYDQLSPYGQWVDYPGHGYVWLPDAGSDFYPYSSGGRWIMTDYGWTWFSDYDWGWAPFHYGRWDYDNYYGWYWLPDNVWGPAWVIWRQAPGYYGWAPMGPGMNIGSNYGNYYNNYVNRWIFVNDRYFGRNNFNNYYASPNDYNMLLSNSTVINNIYVDNSRQITYISGPNRSDVRRVTGRRVSSYTIQENSVPGQSLSSGQLRIFRPQVIRSSANEQRSAPSVITSRQDVRKPYEMNSPSQQINFNNWRQEQQQNARSRQNTVNQQNALDRQNAADQQTAVQRQNEVDQLNAVNRRNAIDRQNDVNRQNAADQQDAVNQQQTVNRQNARDRQEAVRRQNDVNKQNVRNNEKILQQENVNKNNNERRENSSNPVKETPPKRR